MFAEKHYPEVMLPEELDNYLAKGWYRMGQTIFTTHFLCFGDHFYSAIWIRLDLKAYQFRKSLRKILQRNSRLFRTVIRPWTLDREKERLYQSYKSHFPGLLAPSLKDALLDGEDFNVYNTYEVAIYHGRQLVAASFFDMGRNTAASITGIYDPQFARYSLGFYTMLMEITFCMDQDLRYFYPGYVVPGYPRFDYKLRIGEVDYFDLYHQQWLPFSSLSEEHIPLNRMRSKLTALQQKMNQEKIPVKQKLYPLFEANLFGFWKIPFFDFPVLLHCFPQKKTADYLIIVFDVRTEAYHLYECEPKEAVLFYFNESYSNSFDSDQYFTELIGIDRKLVSSPDPEIILDALREYQKKVLLNF